MAMLGAAALLLFGPEQLPRVARKAGSVMREIQNTSQSFIREMERAADLQDAAATKPAEPPAYDPMPYDAGAYDAAAYDETPTVAMTAIEPPAKAVMAMEPPAPDPEPPTRVGEKLAEPRPALGFAAPPATTNGTASAAAESPPEADHPAHL
jgi:Sec-independent protein translocase protein TatA